MRAEALAASIESSAGLVVVDSLTVGSYGIDPKEARDIIALLKDLERLGTVLAIDHIRTPEAGADASGCRPFGSAFKHHLARSLLMVTKAASGAIAIRNTKANFGPKSAPLYLSMSFENESRVAKVGWLEPGDQRLSGMSGISG